MLERLVSWICKKENNKLFVTIVVLFIIYVLYLIIYPRIVYRNDIKEFLKNKYNDEFVIKYIEHQKMIVYEGQNIKNAYAYKIYTKAIPDVYSYIICEELVSEDINIYESETTYVVSIEDYNKNIYGEKINAYNQKLKVKEDLEKLYGEAIEFDLLRNTNTIFIEVKTKMEDSLYDNFDEFSMVYNSTIDVLKDTDIIVSIRYADCLREITGNTEKLTKENIASMY